MSALLIKICKQFLFFLINQRVVFSNRSNALNFSYFLLIWILAVTIVDSTSIKIMTFIQAWNVNAIVNMKVEKRNWIKMQNVDEVKELKALILKGECLKEQN